MLQYPKVHRAAQTKPFVMCRGGGVGCDEAHGARRALNTALTLADVVSLQGCLMGVFFAVIDSGDPTPCVCLCAEDAS